MEHLVRYTAFMSQELPAAEQHERPERFPSQEEIASALDVILGDRNAGEPRIRSDGEGVHFYEVDVFSEDGGKREYNFQRAKYQHQNPFSPTTARFSASIHMTLYDADGIPYDGQCVANYRDGAWQYIPESTS